MINLQIFLKFIEHDLYFFSGIKYANQAIHNASAKLPSNMPPIPHNSKKPKNPIGQSFLNIDTS